MADSHTAWIDWIICGNRINSTIEYELQVWLDDRAAARPTTVVLAAELALQMRNDKAELDGQVLATLRAPTLSGRPVVMNPKRISHHIGHFITGTGWGPSPQAVAASLRRLAARGLAERADHSRTSWTITSGSR